MAISWYSCAFDMLKAGMCSRKGRSWLPMRESLWCWGWRQATIYGSISISPFVLLVHPSCCLLLGSQQLFCFGHSSTVGAEYLVLLGGSPAAACPWCSLGVFTGSTRVSSTPAMCFAFAEAPVSSCWGWAAQSLVWHSVTHRCCRHSGEQGRVTAEHPQGARGFLWKRKCTCSVDGTWLEHLVLPQLGGGWGWRGGHKRHLSPCLL